MGGGKFAWTASPWAFATQLASRINFAETWRMLPLCRAHSFEFNFVDLCHWAVARTQGVAPYEADGSADGGWEPYCGGCAPYCCGWAAACMP